VTFERIKAFLRTREGIVLSVLFHLVVIVWGLVSLATRPLEAMPQDVVAVDVITDDKLSQMMKGIKTGDKDATKPQADKVGDPKPVDPTVGKIDDKKPPIQPTAEKQTPKQEDKPIEKKPDPPKPVAEDKPKEPPKPAKEEAKIDQIADKLKQQDQQKDPPKPEAKQTPQPPKPQKQYAFNATDMKALLDKRDPTRQSIAGAEPNQKPGLGLAQANAPKQAATWTAAFVNKIKSCWSVPAGIRDAENMEATVYIELGADGRLLSPPRLDQAPSPRNPVGPAFVQSTIRAIEQCQPYSFLPQSEYKTTSTRGGWDRIEMTFSPRDLY